MTHVLLTGAAGFVGAHCLRKILNETDWTVTCPVTYQHKGRRERILWAAGPQPGWYERIDVFYLDLAEPVAIDVLTRKRPPDIIINFASDTHPPRSIDSPVEFTHNNVNITLYLLEYARALPRLETFIQISTDSVYGPAPIGTHVEWDPIIPNNPYTASKASQEALAIAWWRSYGVPSVIVATMNPMGETQDVEKFIPMATGMILRDEPLQIHSSNGEIGKRTFIDADVMVDGLFHVLSIPNTRFGDGPDRPDRWNISGERELDNLQVAETIADALGESFDYDLIEVDRPAHGHRYAMSNEKIKKTGWEPADNIYDAIARTVRWSAKNMEWLA
jgi:dTDP-glucose 4,6-dehydratase